jgi:hypothetical protein
MKQFPGWLAATAAAVFNSKDREKKSEEGKIFFSIQKHLDSALLSSACTRRSQALHPGICFQSP